MRILSRWCLSAPRKCDHLKRDIAQALAARTGAILPLLTGLPNAGYVLEEQHLCVDTTAAGGNAALLAESLPDT